MKKVIRLSENDLVRLIERVINEQPTQTKSPEECIRLRKKIDIAKSRAQSVIAMAPRQLQDILKKAFETGVNQGPEAFKNALPREARETLDKKIRTTRMPKTNSEIESMMSQAQQEVENIQEQVKSWLGLFINIGMILMVLWVLLIIIGNTGGDIAGYCG
jgi:flagellar biosynthesis/type III secretory pathway protein FliH